VGFTAVGARVDHYAYDLMTRAARLDEWTPQSVIVAVDEKDAGCAARHAQHPPILKETLEKIAAAQPAAVAIDVNLHDQPDEAEDAQLASAMAANKKLILSCQLVGGRWEDPAPRFMALAAALGHVHLPPERLDGVSRDISLEVIAGGKQRWAMSLEAFRLARGSRPGAIARGCAGGRDIDSSGARRYAADRMLIRFQRCRTCRRYLGGRDRSARGRASRQGCLSRSTRPLSAANDRLVNPLEQDLPGVAIPCGGFRNTGAREILHACEESTVAYWCAGFASGGGADLRAAGRWPAYGLGALLMMSAVATPVLYFRNDEVFPVSRRCWWRGWQLPERRATSTFSCGDNCAAANRKNRAISRRIHWVAH
jgi:hypothetical protein